MTCHRLFGYAASLVSALLLAALLSAPASAHCDSMDGPVVKDAQKALTEKTVEPVLKWVGAADEPGIRAAFDETLAVRGESDAARHLADRYFFETLIRVHRATEGEGFTGLKPAGSTDPAIAAADRALIDGNIDPLADEIAAAVRTAILARFAEASSTRATADRSVEQGRDYVRAYVQFTHFVERAHALVVEGASHAHRTPAEEGH